VTENSYLITVRGSAGQSVRAAFENVEVTIEEDKTTLRCGRIDQAALYGILQRIQDLGLEVLEVHHVAPGSV
jgi:hypothetical protein